MIHSPSRGSSGPPEWEAQLTAYLSEHGLRLTRQRRAIAECFFETEGHPSIEELHARVRERDGRIGQATVYRTVNLLVDSGLAASSRFGGSASRYEAADDREHHDHLVCVACGRIVEFFNETIERLQEEVASAHGFEIVDHKMEIYGRCSDCR